MFKNAGLHQMRVAVRQIHRHHADRKRLRQGDELVPSRLSDALRQWQRHR